MLKPRHIMALGGVSALLFAFAPAALASSSVDVYGQVTGGSLSLNPISVTNGAGNPGTNDGLANGLATPWETTLVTTGNTAASYSEVVGAYDDTGSGAGWHATITSTEYTGVNGAAATQNGNDGGVPFEFGNTGDSSLGAGGPSIAEASTLGAIGTTDVGDSYDATVGDTGLGVIPQGGTTGGGSGFTGDNAATAAEFYNASAGTGMGDFNLALPVSVVIPADAYSGVYQSTQTLAIVSGP
jgi:hypothetical protein